MKQPEKKDSSALQQASINTELNNRNLNQLCLELQ
jgi:hypothetical protein